MKPKNPFTVLGYIGPEYFCDRVAETHEIVNAVCNERNLTLIAPRRYGKTGLIHNAFNKLPNEYAKVYLDIFATHDLAEFTRLFATTAVGSLSTTAEKTISAVATFFKSCRPTIVPQEDGMPKISFDIAETHADATLRETFEFLKSRNTRVVVAIDEFQQILDYPEKGTEALLRSFAQEYPFIRFIFAGSRHHLMGEMFLSAKHPFYNSTDILSLDVIDRQKYSDFACHHFENDRQPFDASVFNALYTRFSGITWYIQVILNRLWQNGAGIVNTVQIDEAVRELVAGRSLLFRDLYFSQTDTAQALLTAIARDGEVKEVYSGDFMRRHALKSTSSIRSALNGLVDSDLVYKTETGYIVYDRIFGEWIRQTKV